MFTLFRGGRPLVVGCLLAASSASAQMVGASLRGTITSQGGVALRKAKVEVREVTTGALWSATSDERGFYQAPLLPPGDYEIRVAAEGVPGVTRQGIHLAVGQNAVLDVTLEERQDGEEAGAWTAELASVGLASAARSGLVDDRQIRDLPLNGRSFQQLAVLQTGVTQALAAGTDVVGGRAPKISVNGTRPEMNSFLLDGTSINNVYDKTPGSVAGVLLGVESVLEFQVLTNAYSAEFGRAAGAVVNAVTRSGGNEWHGSAFEFLRNSSMDARNFFDPADHRIPAFKRNQFGGTLGGPMRENKLFFSLGYEALIERLGITGVASVPDAEARRGNLPGRAVSLHPAVPGYLEALFPMPNGASLGGGAAQYHFSRSQPTSEHLLQGRVDHRSESGDTLFVRYTIDRGHVDRQPVNKPPVAFTRERSQNQYVTLEQQHLLAATALNTARLGFNRSVQEADNVRSGSIPAALSFVPGEPFGFVNVTGLVSELGGDYRLPRLDRLNNYQWDDILLLTRGRHNLRFGVQGQRMQFNQHSVSQRGGVVTFSSLENFLRGAAQSVDLSLPGLTDPIRSYRQWLWGFFLQEDLRVRPSLTLNLGLRYEFATVPGEVHGKIANLRRVTDSQITVGGPWFSNPSLRDFGPRVGLAWDPFGRQRTAVRAGFGVFYDQMLAKYGIFSGSLNPPFTTRTSVPNPPLPNVLASFNWNVPVRAAVQTINYELQPPYMLQFHVSVEHAVSRHLDISLGYVGTRGVHLLRVGDANLAPETFTDGTKVYQPHLGRRNPNFNGIFQRVSDAQSFYNALEASVVKELSSGVRAQFSYTFSRAVDDASGINSQDFDNSVQYGLDWYDRKMDRGLSSFHAQHVAALNWTVDFVWARSLRGLGGALLRGWQLNNITTLQSGHPFTVRLGFNRSGNLNTSSFAMHERPNVKPGYTSNPALGGPDRYWDVAAFELPPANQRGNLGRNTVIGPGLVMFDLALVRSVRLGESQFAQFRVEAFNLPNRPNLAIPSGRIAFTNAAGAVAPTWGRITSTVTTSRQVQLGLKLSF